MFKIFILLLVTSFCFIIVSCSSSSSVKPEKKMSWWDKTKCKIMKKNEECE